MGLNLVSGEILSRIKWTLTNVLDLSTPTETFSHTKTIALTNGTGANKAEFAFSDAGTLTTGATVTIDLQALAGAFSTGVLKKIKFFRLELVTATSGYTLKLKEGASNGFSAFFSAAGDEIIIGNGGALQIEAPGDGYTVDATHKTILITNPAGGTATYNIIAIGETT